MNNYKEIVTKAVLNKLKRNINSEYSVPLDIDIDNILGCWIINHTFDGRIKDNIVVINGKYDINIWYSYNDNTKTNVMIKSFDYEVSIINNYSNKDVEIITRCLNQPSVVDVDIKDGNIIIKVESTMGIEIIGNSLIKVNVSNDYDEYDEDISTNIDTNYLK